MGVELHLSCIPCTKDLQLKHITCVTYTEVFPEVRTYSIFAFTMDSKQNFLIYLVQRLHRILFICLVQKHRLFLLSKQTIGPSIKGHTEHNNIITVCSTSCPSAPTLGAPGLFLSHFSLTSPSCCCTTSLPFLQFVFPKGHTVLLMAELCPAAGPCWNNWSWLLSDVRQRWSLLTEDISAVPTALTHEPNTMRG